MSSAQSRIAELAAAVALHTHRVDSYLAENGLPYPSFDADGPVDLRLPPEIEQSRTAALQASQELNDLLQGPRDLIFNHHHNSLVYLKFISHFDLANKVPVDGEITFTELAASIGVDYGALTRILRLSIAHRIFKEPRPGVVAHSAASREIAEDTRVASWVGANVDDMWPAAGRVVDALIKWPLATEPNQIGFSLANETNRSFYEELDKSPERARRFGGAMSCFTTSDGYSLSHLTDGYPWESISSGTVVDLGGSHGDAAFALSRKYPTLNFIVQELPQVVENSKEEPGLDVKFMVHDLFEEQPVHGAEVYLYRWVLHNWPDKYCVKALQALIPALKQGSRVLVMDFVMPPPGTLPNNIERNLRAMDLTMLEIGNAKERDLGEWESLFEQAHPKFVFKGMRQPPGSRLAILEATWAGGAESNRT
ncbi:putative O-methyltransferase [Talaromyces proteolyticus]|uniref:O-methyltransferase n=1 Tax=Talaromyces proteolyticus TaxID=1131652 RepID=A0AAD4Q048_9EURO|nr:putative O-methyltransferase [Talaromyces proteolyticus]KAH8696533.1 putative O-methyltransferase [Talaromyces proteolyticus]